MSTVFYVKGKITIAESGMAVALVRVKAYDSDLIYDDLLGEAITDAEGRYEISFTEKDFKELFERQPDIYLVIETRGGTPIYSTQQNIYQEAPQELQYDVAIPAASLPEDDTPTLPEGIHFTGGKSILYTWKLTQDDLFFAKDGMYDLITLKDTRSSLTHNLGFPVVPYQVLQFAVPATAGNFSVKLAKARWQKAVGHFMLQPGQHPKPASSDTGNGTSVKQRSNGKLPAPEIRPSLSKIYDDAGIHVPLNETAGQIKQVEVEVTGASWFHQLHMVSIKVYPLRYNIVDGSIHILEGAELQISYDTRRKESPATAKLSITRSDVSKVYSLIDNPQDIQISLPDTARFDYQLIDTATGSLSAFKGGKSITKFDKDSLYAAPWYWYLWHGNWDYVIITDDYKWNENGTRGAAAPNLVSTFEKLAAWKTKRGVRARVVTISEILNNAFGQHWVHGVTRDVPEAIRNFLKFAYEFWNTRWCLLGGDIDIVPVRHVLGFMDGWTFISRSTNSSPEVNKIYADTAGSYLRFQAPFQLTIDDVFFAANGAHTLRYNTSASPSNPGWYFADSTYTVMSSMPTNFIVMKASTAVLNVIDLLPQYDNLQPCDLYYSSIINPLLYNQLGKHDWDLDGNGIYGWYDWGNPDGIDFGCDISVGRAPIETADQAQVFVDKVITYETFTDARTGNPLNSGYTRRMMATGGSWGSGWNDGPFNKLTLAPLDGACLDKEEVIELLRSHTLNNDFIRRFYEDIYFVDHTESNLAILDGEQPHLDKIRRFIDGGVHFLTASGHGWWGGAAGFSSTDAFYIYPSNMRNHPHNFIMFMDSCLTCEFDLDKWSTSARTGGHQMAPGAVCLGKDIVRAPLGGAVAYVGYCRLGAVGQSQEKIFWDTLRFYGQYHLGKMLDRAREIGISRTRTWQIYNMNLMGDPEMPVYATAPKEINCSHTAFIYGQDKFTIGVFRMEVPVHDAVVCVSQLSDTNQLDKTIFELVSASGGYYTFDTTGARAGTIHVVVSGPGYIPYVTQVQKVAAPVSAWKYLTRGRINDVTRRSANTIYAASHDNNIYALTGSSTTPVWTRYLGGPVISTDAAANGTVLSGTINRTANNLFLHDAMGNLLHSWNTSVETIAVKLMAAQNIALAATSGQGLIAYRISDGSVAWQRNDLNSVLNLEVGTDTHIYIAYNTSSGSHAACLDAGGRTQYDIPLDSGTTATTLDTGNVFYIGVRSGKIYRVNTDGSTWATPYNASSTVISLATLGTFVFAGTGDGHLLKLGNDGTTVWNYDFGDRTAFIIPRHNNIVAGCWHGVILINHAGVPIWFRETTGAVSSLVLQGQHVYAGCRDGMVYRIDVGSDILIVDRIHDIRITRELMLVNDIDISAGSVMTQ